MTRRLGFLAAMVLVLVGASWAQAPAPVALPDWKTLIDWTVLLAGAINCVLVIAVVQILKGTLPYLRLTAPWLLPTLTLVIGPLLTYLQNALAAALGWPIDLSPIIAVFTGGTAVTLHQIKEQREAPEKRIVRLQARVAAQKAARRHA